MVLERPEPIGPTDLRFFGTFCLPAPREFCKSVPVLPDPCRTLSSLRVQLDHLAPTAVGTTVTRVLESRALDDGSVDAGEGLTDLVIVPGHRFRAVDALVTNFHLPRSSLLLLVSAFAGRERVLGAYREALSLGYRFYSYGDAMLIR